MSKRGWWRLVLVAAAIQIGSEVCEASGGAPTTTQPATSSVEPMWMTWVFRGGTLLVLIVTGGFVGVQAWSTRKKATAEALLQAMRIDMDKDNRRLRGWVMAFGRPLRPREWSLAECDELEQMDRRKLLESAQDACRHMDELAMLGMYSAIGERRMIYLWGDVLCKTWIVLRCVVEDEQEKTERTGSNKKTFPKWGAFAKLGRKAYEKLGWPEDFQAKPEQFDEKRNVLSLWSRVYRWLNRPT